MTAWISIGVSIVILIVIPLLVLVVRIAMKYQETDDRILDLTRRSFEYNEKMDERVRWLEENLWKRR